MRTVLVLLIAAISAILFWIGIIVLAGYFGGSIVPVIDLPAQKFSYAIVVDDPYAAGRPDDRAGYIPGKVIFSDENIAVWPVEIYSPAIASVVADWSDPVPTDRTLGDVG